jgi:hypothetical protein
MKVFQSFNFIPAVKYQNSFITSPRIVRDNADLSSSRGKIGYP